ncbi:MAG: hypothetical protein ACKO70_08790 [Actinomycetota bacterium]
MSVFKGESAPLAVVDIDGVLADVRHRLHHLSGRRRDWDAFFAAAGDDAVLPEGRAQIDKARADGLDIVYLTGRPERCRPGTLAWLGEHGFPEAPLVMRADDDRRPARRFKVEVVEGLASAARVSRVIDDDDAVCQAMREAGFPVVHARWMDEGDVATLAQAQETLGRT